MKLLMKTGGLLLLGVGIASMCSAGFIITPEIDPGTGMNALALLAGAVLIVRGRRR